MRILSLTIVLFISVMAASAQHRDGVKFYKKGTAALEKGKNQEAIDMLGLSINAEPTVNAHFNRGIAYLNMGDTCHFCHDMRVAASMKDHQAGTLVADYCVLKYDITKIPEQYKKEYSNIAKLEVTKYRCSDDSVVAIKTFSDTTQNRRVLDDGTEVFLIVDSMPGFVGGQSAMNRYIAMQIQYPAEARLNNEKGKVYLHFVVDADGYVKNVEVVKGVSASLDREAIRVIESMPRWKPGKHEGKAVAVSMNLPITFHLD